jgi:hypothetical protein
MSSALRERLESVRRVIQRDVNGRGLHGPGSPTLAEHCAADFSAACRQLANAASVSIITGFFIPHGQPPAAETDGPLGAVFLAQALRLLGIPSVLAGEEFCTEALRAGLAMRSDRSTRVVVLPPSGLDADAYREAFFREVGRPSHLVAIERVGPSHTRASLLAQDPQGVEEFEREMPIASRDRCHNMRGQDITASCGPAHWLFEFPDSDRPVTLGIGDGGNEIGMGRLPWSLVRRAVPWGGRIACRVATDYLIVCGVSNWGAYGLAAGTALVRGMKPDPDLFDPDRERQVLEAMVRAGPLVDGVTGRAEASVDGLDAARYLGTLREIAAVARGEQWSSAP